MKIVHLLVAMAALASAADTHSDLTGVWRAQIEGQPTIVMKVTARGDEIAGAVLFYIVKQDERGRTQPGVPEPMFQVKSTGKVLDFEVRPSGPLAVEQPRVSFRLRVTGTGKGLLIREGLESESIAVTRDE